jgi:hypothetical protein
MPSPERQIEFVGSTDCSSFWLGRARSATRAALCWLGFLQCVQPLVCFKAAADSIYSPDRRTRRHFFDSSEQSIPTPVLRLRGSNALSMADSLGGCGDSGGRFHRRASRARVSRVWPSEGKENGDLAHRTVAFAIISQVRARLRRSLGPRGLDATNPLFFATLHCGPYHSFMRHTTTSGSVLHRDGDRAQRDSPAWFS